jgi:hypothetical protein
VALLANLPRLGYQNYQGPSEPERPGTATSMTDQRFLPLTGLVHTVGQSGSPTSSGPALIFAVLTLAITFGSLVVALLFSGTPLNGDAGILLDCARLIYHGWIPYVDYVEMNPPMAHYVNVIPVYLASVLHLEIPTAFYIFVLALAVYSAVVMIFLLSRLDPAFPLPARLVLGSVFLLFSLWVLRVGEFGQKDHLFALAYVPWLYCREIRHGRSSVPTWTGIVVGLISGPLFALKPHFCVLVAVTEMWLWFLSRRSSALWCPEILVLAGWVVAYVVHFCFAPSEMRDALFLRWLPFIIANYDVYDHPVSEIVRQFSMKFWLLQIPLILAVLVLVTRTRLPNTWKLQLHGLVVSTLLAWAIFIIQHKGWTYHLLPAISLEMLLTATMLIIAMEPEAAAIWLSKVRLDVRAGVFLLVCFCVSFLSIGMSHKIFTSGKLPESINDFVRVIEQQAAPDEKVAFISTSVSPAYPTLIYAKRLPGTRFLQSFPIAYLYKGVHPRKDGSHPYRAPDEAPPEERRFLNELGSDIIKRRPKLVFVDDTNSCQACPKGFRVEEYLKTVGWLRRFMKDYRLTQFLHGFAVYVRID